MIQIGMAKMKKENTSEMNRLSKLQMPLYETKSTPTVIQGGDGIYLYYKHAIWRYRNYSAWERIADIRRDYWIDKTCIWNRRMFYCHSNVVLLGVHLLKAYCLDVNSGSEAVYVFSIGDNEGYYSVVGNEKMLFVPATDNALGVLNVADKVHYEVLGWKQMLENAVEEHNRKLVGVVKHSQVFVGDDLYILVLTDGGNAIIQCAGEEYGPIKVLLLEAEGCSGLCHADNRFYTQQCRNGTRKLIEIRDSDGFVESELTLPSESFKKGLIAEHNNSLICAQKDGELIVVDRLSKAVNRKITLDAVFQDIDGFSVNGELLFSNDDGLIRVNPTSGNCINIDFPTGTLLENFINCII